MKTMQATLAAMVSMAATAATIGCAGPAYADPAIGPCDIAGLPVYPCVLGAGRHGAVGDPVAAAHVETSIPSPRIKVPTKHGRAAANLRNASALASFTAPVEAPGNPPGNVRRRFLHQI